jgi:curved DNA-binding protein CbpA
MDLLRDLDSLDYFQILQLAPAATPQQIKEAYHRLARLYHPDRFAALDDQDLRQRVGRVFKRVTEAYVVLRDDRKRAKYLAEISGPDRAKKLRFTEASDTELKSEAKRARVEQVGTTPKGRECFKNGLKELEAQRVEQAMRHFKTALMYEPNNTGYKEKLKEAEVLRERDRPKDDFRIK